MIKGFFKQQKPKRFHFKTRYYDENKERLQQQIARIEKDMQLENQGKNFSFKDHWQQNSRRKAHQKSNLTIAVIIALLSLIFYFILKN